jgi:hypothetical protein
MIDRCASIVPELEPVPGDREVACIRWKDIDLGGY